MKKFAFLLLVLALGVVFGTQNACYYDHEDLLYGTNAACDTSNVKYSATVSKLISEQCLSCHIAGGSQESSPLDGYTNLKVYIDNGKVLSRINDTGSPMPPSGLLPSCDRNKIQAWINAGAANN